MRGLSLVVASGGHSSSRCAGLSLMRPLLLRSTGSRRAGSVIVAHGPSCLAACGIFPDQGSNPCPLHWQADSQPLRHQGSPHSPFLKTEIQDKQNTNFTHKCQHPNKQMNLFTNRGEVQQLFPLSSSVPHSNAKQIGLFQRKSPKRRENKVPSCTHWSDLPYRMELVSCRMSIPCSNCQALG